METSLDSRTADVKEANTAALTNSIFGKYALTAEELQAEREEIERLERLNDRAELLLDELEGY